MGDTDVLNEDPVWSDTVISLMAIADQASAGMGFVVDKKSSDFADFLLREHRRLIGKGKRELPHRQ